MINLFKNPLTGILRIGRIRFHPKLSQISQKSHRSEKSPPGSWKSVDGLVRCPANDVPLSPISFLERAAKIYRERTSLLYRSVRRSWADTHQRCLKMASALAQLGISRGDVVKFLASSHMDEQVATLALNVPALQELHFAVPMAGAVLCALNARHDSAMVSVLLRHSEAKILFVESPLIGTAQGAIDLIAAEDAKPPTVVVICETDADISALPHLEYESLLRTGRCSFKIRRPICEWDPISINYTSGTTHRPKGVVYSHRGAYLNSIATFHLHGMGGAAPPVYLWTVPLFHCNGWCLVWALAALGGTSVLLRKVAARDIFESIALHDATHLGGAPAVLNMVANSAAEDRKPLPHRVQFMTGGAPPPPQVIGRVEKMGFEVRHLYGLTETHGPGTSCEWKPEWDSLQPEERFRLKCRQGVPHLCVEGVEVMDPATLERVPDDGEAMGEVMFRGNTVMSGYLNDLPATEEAFRGGWFRSGDLAVRHSDGYIEVKDRSKDIIISGGENISSVEVETVLYSHPAVLEAAVVGRPDDHWGETPCAFVTLKKGSWADAQEIIQFCRSRMPHYMAPRTVVIEDIIPTTPTGKVQKFVLREKAGALGAKCCWTPPAR